MSISTAAARSTSTSRTPSVPSPAAAPLYVAATHKVRDRNGTAPHDWVPYGVEHAWPAGSRRTLCGQFTTGWTVFWERRFAAGQSTSCPACIEASLPAASRRRLDPVRSLSA